MSRTIVFALICGFFAAFVLANPQYAEAEEEVPQPETQPITFPIPAMDGDILFGNSEVITMTSEYFDSKGYNALIPLGFAYSNIPESDTAYQYVGISHTFQSDFIPNETMLQFYMVQQEGEIGTPFPRWQVWLIANDDTVVSDMPWLVKTDVGTPCFDGYICRRGQVKFEAPYAIPAETIKGFVLTFWDVILTPVETTVVGVSINGTLAPWPPEAETFNIYLPLVVR